MSDDIILLTQEDTILVVETSSAQEVIVTSQEEAVLVIDSTPQDLMVITLSEQGMPGPSDWNLITNKPATFTPSDHANEAHSVDFLVLGDVTPLLDNKVDKVMGKQLSTEDYSTLEKTKLSGIEDGAEKNVNADWSAITGDAVILNKPSALPPTAHDNSAHSETYVTALTAPVTSVAGKTGAVTLAKSDVGLGNVDNTSDLNKPISTATQVALNDKVDKIAGYGLSQEDYTTTEQNKLASIAYGAEVNVRADWNAVSGDAVILNKPTTLPPTAHGNESHTTTFASYYDSRFTDARTPLDHGNEAHNVDYLEEAPINGNKYVRSGGAWDVLPPTSANWGSIGGTLTNQTDLNIALGLKVDKVAGKQLSTEDYTTTEKSKLSGIQDGAEVNAQIDWNAVSGDSFIANKPTEFIPADHGADAHTALTHVDLDTATPFTTGPVGSAYWDATYKTWAIKTSADTTLQLGQELPVLMHNGTGSTIPNGTPVRITSGNGYPIIEPARADDMDQDCTAGITTQDITAGATGFVTCFGLIHDINTLAYVAGAEVYLAPGGGFTSIQPAYPNTVVHLGHVISSHATTGSIFVDINPETFQKFFDVMKFAGVVDASQILLGYEAATQTMTVEPAGDYWAYFYGGKEYRITTPLEITHPATTGLHFIYLNSSGVLTTSTTTWDILTTIPLSVIYYNAVTGQGITFNERHQVADKYWHQGQHNTIGAYYGSGLAASDYVLFTDTDQAVQFSISSGVIRDEDIHNAITGQLAGGTYNVAYRLGVDGAWSIDQAPTPYIEQSYAQYNQWTGATWQLTELTNGQFYNIYVLAVPALDGALTVWCIQGQQVYTTLNSATGATFRQDIQWGAMPVAEFSIIHRFTLRAAASYTNTGKVRIEAYADMRGTTTSVQIIGGGSTTHNALAGLNVGDYLHLTQAEKDALATKLEAIAYAIALG